MKCSLRRHQPGPSVWWFAEMGDRDKYARLIAPRLLAQRDALLKAAKEAVVLLDGMWINKDETPAYITGRIVAKLQAAIQFVEGHQ